MKVLPISDIHMDKETIDYLVGARHSDDAFSNIEMILIAGDISERQYTGFFISEICTRLYKAYDEVPIVFISGNHDYLDYENLLKLVGEGRNIHYLHNSTKTINGVTIYGSPFTPKFFNWNYMADEEKIFQIVDGTMFENTDIALFHGPPKGVCDEVVGREGDHRGSSAIYEQIKIKSPSYVFCGHIHTGDHSFNHIQCNNNITTQVKNVSVMDESYCMRPDFIESVTLDLRR